ncbi:MAG: single-stranded DNA-binding protein [Candidatus Saccharibacteria bacterium]|nr:single-stranded DNA-binding protein [Candidatus Saccharibacteria bacterium]
MRGFSKAIIAGNLTRDPELRSTPSGASVCGFSVAVNRVYRDANGEQKEEVSYIDCTAWGKLGEMIANYAKRGSGVLISGRLSQRSWEDKNGGGKRSRVEIVVEDFNFTGAPREGGAGGGFSGGSSMSNAGSQPSSDLPDDIPEGDVDLSEIPF